MTTSEQVVLALDCQDAVHLLTQALEAHDLRVYRSFDLRDALTGLPDCTCPHHGTEQCTCQYAVLLVYGRAPGPSVVRKPRADTAPSPVQLVAHGRDGQTWLQVLPFSHPSAVHSRVRAMLASFLQQHAGQTR